MKFSFGYSAGERRLIEMVHALATKQEKIMAAIDDLTTAETNLETVVGALVTDIQTLAAELAAAQSSNNDAAVEAVVTKMNALAASAQAVLTPPATPATPSVDSSNNAS